jgi:hypothetical protein
VTLSGFEHHSGSQYKKPGDYVYISQLNINLRDLIALVAGEMVAIHTRGAPTVQLQLPWPRGIPGRPVRLPSAVPPPVATAPVAAAELGAGGRVQRVSAGVALQQMRAAAGTPSSFSDDDLSERVRAPSARRGAAAALAALAPLGQPSSSHQAIKGLRPPLHVTGRLQVRVSCVSYLTAVP